MKKSGQLSAGKHTLYEGECVRLKTFHIGGETSVTRMSDASWSFIDMKDQEAGIKSLYPIGQKALSGWESEGEADDSGIVVVRRTAFRRYDPLPADSNCIR